MLPDAASCGDAFILCVTPQREHKVNNLMHFAGASCKFYKKVAQRAEVLLRQRSVFDAV